MNQDLVKHLNQQDFQATISKGVTLVDFFAQWCGPCKMLSPIIQEVAKSLQGQATIAKVDIDHNESLAASLNITAVPTIILFKDGQEVARLTGLRDQTSLEKLIKSHL